MSFGVRDIRTLYPRITENHLRYLEKWGLIRSASARGGGEFTFTEVARIKQLAGELERSVPLKTALRTLLAEHQGQLQFDFHASGSPPAKVVALHGRPSRKAVERPAAGEGGAPPGPPSAKTRGAPRHSHPDRQRLSVFRSASGARRQVLHRR